MANEIQYQMQLTATKNGAQFQRSYGNVATMLGIQMSNGTNTATTGDTTVPLGAVGTIGWVFLHNLDATNFITAGSDGAVYPIKLLPGEALLTRFNGAAVHVKADTASCQYEFGIVEA